MMFISIIQLIIEFKRFFFVTLRGHSPRHERIQKYYFVGAICDIFSIRISFFYLYLQTGIRRDMSYNDFARSDSGQRRGNTTTSLKQHSMFSFICIPDGAFAVKYQKFFFNRPNVCKAFAVACPLTTVRISCFSQSLHHEAFGQLQQHPRGHSP